MRATERSREGLEEEEERGLEEQGKRRQAARDGDEEVGGLAQEENEERSSLGRGATSHCSAAPALNLLTLLSHTRARARTHRHRHHVTSAPGDFSQHSTTASSTYHSRRIVCQYQTYT
eukprot:270166-Rhodomonas_salina.1